MTQPLCRTQLVSRTGSSGGRGFPEDQPIAKCRGHSSGGADTQVAWLRDFVPPLVSGGHAGYSCFLFWVPTPTVGRDKPQEVARP